MKTVILDNYDSFTFNLYQYLGEIDERPAVFRNDEISVDELRDLAPDRIVLSPGPGHPADPSYFGVCRRVILELGPTIPILGVCLGHQGIIQAFGGRVVRAERVVHGKTSHVYHDGRGILAGLPQRFRAMRYHSLVGARDGFPKCLLVTAWTGGGEWGVGSGKPQTNAPANLTPPHSPLTTKTIMGVQHREYPIFGVQFHPESIGTKIGKRLLENFLHCRPMEPCSPVPVADVPSAAKRARCRGYPSSSLSSR